jgi:hypothetical protein
LVLPTLRKRGWTQVYFQQVGVENGLIAAMDAINWMKTCYTFTIKVALWGLKCRLTLLLTLKIKTMTTRDYPYNDALMLAGGKMVAANLRCCIKELSEIRSLWTRSYITGLDNRLDNAFSEILGFNVDRVHQFLRFDIYDSLQQAAFDLGCLKIQLEVDYQNSKEKQSDYLTKLGFTMFQQKLSMLSEEELICLLEHFALNLSAGTRRELVGNGVNPFLLERLTRQAMLLKEMKQVQATLISPNKELSGSQLATLCDLYGEVEGICTIASTFFEHKSKKRELFSFPLVINRLKGVCGEVPKTI